MALCTWWYRVHSHTLTLTHGMTLGYLGVFIEYSLRLDLFLFSCIQPAMQAASSLPIDLNTSHSITSGRASGYIVSAAICHTFQCCCRCSTSILLLLCLSLSKRILLGITINSRLHSRDSNVNYKWSDFSSHFTVCVDSTENWTHTPPVARGEMQVERVASRYNNNQVPSITSTTSANNGNKCFLWLLFMLHSITIAHTHTLCITCLITLFFRYKIPCSVR